MSDWFCCMLIMWINVLDHWTFPFNIDLDTILKLLQNKFLKLNLWQE